mmetsp:Transcript_11408/g.21161  ORF Transcript_11408/g.21161 Transcript_11408/m.21161 type:complete len:103 (-) Transcript_11408:1170-1478(-)
MAFRGFFKSSLVAFLSFSLLLLGCGTVSAQPSMGPYETTQAMYDVEALDETNRTAWVWSPVASNTDESFPLIIYLHGFLGKCMYYIEAMTTYLIVQTEYIHV